MKLYQTVTLPEGVYEFSAKRGSWEWNNPSGVNLVAAEGTGLPDYANLATEALGYSTCGSACTFIVEKEGPVTLGLVTNQSGQTCHTIQAFTLKKKDYTFKEADAPVGIHEAENEVVASVKLQTYGGLGSIRIITSEPQRVDIFDLGGRLVWSEFVEYDAFVPVRKGVYVVGHQKVMVR